MALGLPLPGGERCKPLFWRASDSYVERRARAAFTTPSLTSGALCMGVTLLLRGTTRIWTW
eukprot:479667-Alexandrium_andersonii.AAC.1